MHKLVSLGMRAGLCLLLAAITSTALAQVTVKISSPASGTVGTSFTINASATSPNGVDGWYIYVDNNAAWNTPGPTSSISAPLTLTVGTHNVIVRAWDQTGAHGDGVLTLNVVQSTSTTTTTSRTVTALSPANGATVSSPVTFTASATSPNGISGWVIYANTNNVYQVDNNSNTLNAVVSLAAGTYSVYIRAWDKVSGYGTSPTFTITVASGSGSTPPPPTTSSALPTPPSNAVVISHIEDSTASWNKCTDCAGGDTLATDYWMAPFQTSPSLDGSSREFYVGGPPWTAALFYHTVWSYRGQYNYATHFLSDYWVYVDSSSMQNVWDLEYDVYQALGGYEYMMGTHCVFGSGSTGQYWEIYSQADHRWKATNVPCSRNLMPAGKWHHIQWMMERVPNSHAYKYVTLVVNGNAYSLNSTQYAAPINWGDTLGVQWQTDTNSNGGGAHVWIDKATFTIW